MTDLDVRADILNRARVAIDAARLVAADAQDPSRFIITRDQRDSLLITWRLSGWADPVTIDDAVPPNLRLYGIPVTVAEGTLTLTGTDLR